MDVSGFHTVPIPEYVEVASNEVITSVVHIYGSKMYTKSTLTSSQTIQT